MKLTKTEIAALKFVLREARGGLGFYSGSEEYEGNKAQVELAEATIKRITTTPRKKAQP